MVDETYKSLFFESLGMADTLLLDGAFSAGFDANSGPMAPGQ